MSAPRRRVPSTGRSRRSTPVARSARGWRRRGRLLGRSVRQSSATSVTNSSGRPSCCRVRSLFSTASETGRKTTSRSPTAPAGARTGVVWSSNAGRRRLVRHTPSCPCRPRRVTARRRRRTARKTSRRALLADPTGHRTECAPSNCSAVTPATVNGPCATSPWDSYSSSGHPESPME